MCEPRHQTSASNLDTSRMIIRKKPKRGVNNLQILFCHCRFLFVDASCSSVSTKSLRWRGGREGQSVVFESGCGPKSIVAVSNPLNLGLSRRGGVE